MAVRQVITGRMRSHFGSGTYFSHILSRTGAWIESHAAAQHVCLAPGVLRGFFVRRDLVLGTSTDARRPGPAKGWRWDVIHNGVETACAVTLLGTTDLGYSDVAVPYQAGDRLMLRRTSINDPPGTLEHVNYYFDGAEVGVSMYGGNGVGSGPDLVRIGDTDDPRYIEAFTVGSWSATREAVEEVIAVNGEVRSYRVDLEDAPGSGNGFTFCWVVDGVEQDGTGGTVNTTLAVTDAATTGTATFVLPTTRGERVCIKAVRSGTPDPVWVRTSVRFVADEDGEWHVGMAGIAPSSDGSEETGLAPGTRYAPIVGSPWQVYPGWSLAYGGVEPFTVSGLIASLAGTLGTGATLAVALQRDEADAPGGPVVTFDDASTLEEDTDQQMAVAHLQRIRVRATLTGVPGTDNYLAWSAIGFALAETTAIIESPKRPPVPHLATPDHYDTGTIAPFFDAVHPDVEVTTGGYLGTNAWTATSHAAYLMRLLRLDVGDGRRWRMGMRVYVTDVPPTPKILLAVVDSTGAIQSSLAHMPDGTLGIFRGAFAQLLRQSTATLPLSEHVRLGFGGVLDVANGSVEAHVNSTSEEANVVARIEGINTYGTSRITWQGYYIGLSPLVKAGHFYVDEFGGFRHGNFVRTLFPIANGVPMGWAADGAATVAQAVDDPVPDMDATTAVSGTVGQQYAVQFEPAPAAVAIKVVQDQSLPRNEGVSFSYAPIIVIDGVVVNTDWHSVPDDYLKSVVWSWRRNPRTDAVWAKANVDPAFGGGRTEV